MFIFFLFETKLKHTVIYSELAFLHLWIAFSVAFRIIKEQTLEKSNSKNIRCCKILAQKRGYEIISKNIYVSDEKIAEILNNVFYIFLTVFDGQKLFIVKTVKCRRNRKQNVITEKCRRKETTLVAAE